MEPKTLNSYFKLAYFDLTKFNQLQLNDFNKSLEKTCSDKQFNHVMTKKDFFESKNVKELCRNGIPFQYFNPVILKLFNLNSEDNLSNYLYRKEKVFKGRAFTHDCNYVPFFTEYSTFTESLPFHILSEKGILSVKEVQWMINSVIPTIEHSPLLIKLNYLLHFFFEDYEVYYILRNIINMSYNKKEIHKIRWHLRFQYEDNRKLVQSIYESHKQLAGKNNTSGLLHLESIGCDNIYWIEDMIFNFFIGYLPFEAIFRVLSFYLREGVKSLYRIFFAIIKEINPTLVAIKDKTSAVESIKKACTEIKDFNKLFSFAFEYNLTRNNNQYIFQEFKEDDEKTMKKSNFYLPNFIPFNKCTPILTDSRLLEIWDHFPYELRIKDCHMIFSTETDGFNLTTLYEAGNKLKAKNLNSENDYNVIFLIQTVNEDIFGGIISRLIVPSSNKYDKPSITQIISFNPTLKVYNPIETYTEDIIYIDNESFAFGIGKFGSAIKLDDSLNHGYSNKTDSFNSPALTKNEDGEYTIKKVEVYILS